MASVSITNQTLTLTIDIDGVETVIRKDNCKVVAIGDVVRITDYRGSIYEFLFSDCTAPDEASANDLRDAIEAFLNSAGGGGGGGITSILSDTLDVTEDAGVARVELPYTNYIGLISQTETSAPVLTEQHDNTGITFTPAYNDVGDYVIEMSQYPPVEKVNVSIQISQDLKLVSARYREGDGILIRTTDDGTVLNGGLLNSRIEIQIFP